MLDAIKIKQARKLISEERQNKMHTDDKTKNYARLCEVAGILDTLIKKLENPGEKDYKI